MTETPDAGMTEYLTQNLHLAKQVAALHRLPPPDRQKYLILRWRCHGCREVVLEVWETEPYRSLRTRIRQGKPSEAWSTRAITEVRSESDAGLLIPAFCSCQSRMLFASLMWEDLEAGSRERTLKAQHAED